MKCRCVANNAAMFRSRVTLSSQSTVTLHVNNYQHVWSEKMRQFTFDYNSVTVFITLFCNTLTANSVLQILLTTIAVSHI